MMASNFLRARREVGDGGLVRFRFSSLGLVSSLAVGAVSLACVFFMTASRLTISFSLRSAAARYQRERKATNLSTRLLPPLPFRPSPFPTQPPSLPRASSVAVLNH